MRKLIRKRLVLGRETLGNLSIATRNQLEAVAGGMTQERMCVPECLTAGNCGCGQPTFQA